MTPGALDDPHDELLFRFIAEQCAAPERAEVERWLRGDPRNARRLDDMRRIWLASRARPSLDVDRMWTRLRSAAERDAGAARQRSTRALAGAAWAAALVVVAGGAVFLAWSSHSAEPDRVVATEHSYATGPAQTANVRLRDGSRVMLAPMSRLRVPDDFGDRERLVTIEGQGFFDVEHNGAMPFRVRAKNAIAEDIGTRFDLRAYQDETGVTVIVADGAVTLGHFHSGSPASAAEGVVAHRGERARTGGPDSMTTVDHVSLRLTDWTAGRLSFVRTPLAEIARTIGRWYDLDVRVTDPAVGERLITADFDSQSPKEMIEALAIAVSADVVQKGRVLTIGAKP